MTIGVALLSVPFASRRAGTAAGAGQAGASLAEHEGRRSPIIGRKLTPSAIVCTALKMSFGRIMKRTRSAARCERLCWVKEMARQERAIRGSI